MLGRVRCTWRGRATNCLNDGLRCRSRWVVIPSRRYGALSHSASTDEGTNLPICMGLVTTSAPHHSSIDDLLSVIHQRFQQGRPEAPTANIALLLTPAFARHALSPSLPLDIFKRVVGNGNSSELSLDALVAVVDRLPSTNGLSEGDEGLAYAVSSNDALLGNLANAPGLRSSAQRPGSLFLRLREASLGPVDAQSKRELNLQLPLSQTIFSTGLVSTLVHTSYGVDQASKELQLQSVQNLESHTLSLPSSTSDRLDFRAPLIPLTAPAKIVHCMGNIIRTVSPVSSDASKPENPHPASQDLESAISAYFKAQQLHPEPVSVWALVTPQHMYGGDSPPATSEGMQALFSLTKEHVSAHWQPDFRHPTETVDGAIGELLANGAKFCKVLSGGGGWGKKAGLLSLDPDPEYSTRELRDDQGWHFDLMGNDNAAAEDQRKQALGQIIQESDVVMFFLAPRSVEPSSAQSRGGCLKSRLTFGSIPSTIDALPETQTHNATEKTPVIRHVRNSFGFLSEGGMALTLNNTRAATMAEEIATKTKFDVPFSTITTSLKDERDELGSERQSKDDIGAEKREYDDTSKRSLSYGGSRREHHTMSMVPQPKICGTRHNRDMNFSARFLSRRSSSLASRNVKASSSSTDIKPPIRKIEGMPPPPAYRRVLLRDPLPDEGDTTGSKSLNRGPRGNRHATKKRTFRKCLIESRPARRTKKRTFLPDEGDTTGSKSLNRGPRGNRHATKERTFRKKRMVFRQMPSRTPTHFRIRRLGLAVDTSYVLREHERVQQEVERRVSKSRWISKRTKGDLWDVLQEEKVPDKDGNAAAPGRFSKEQEEQVVRDVQGFVRR